MAMMILFEQISASTMPVHTLEIDGESFYAVGGVLARRDELGKRIAMREDAQRETIIKRIMGGRWGK